ncbi:DNA-3-methyladenine glycosylase [Gordonia sp. zg691]|uniref:DNA-3-methyladenine glycosylase n=1 Tax=Gordonia jinghuaiqii TaxID=2758710 RepID=UPI00166228D0|nr:DNA-3-methyladenine glycosylase [Gordonia jinghuaiqii]MBD0862358.1 DNA-3-methyladenine glycosylase [Gordonia jinghuaiqii]
MESLVFAMVPEPSAPAPLAEQARSLLGARLVGHGVTIALTEVEAYAGPDDPASHAYTRTARSEIMYGPPGRLYVYRIHGHHCANIVVAGPGPAAAVLLRAGAVTDGIELAHERRLAACSATVSDDHLARGPGNLTRALGITMADLGTDLADPTTPVTLEPAQPGADGLRVVAGPRVGVRRAADVAWRFWIDGEPSVSAYRRHPRAAP